jgi:hypothetical protein
VYIDDNSNLKVRIIQSLSQDSQAIQIGTLPDDINQGTHWTDVIVKHWKPSDPQGVLEKDLYYFVVNLTNQQSQNLLYIVKFKKRGSNLCRIFNKIELGVS